MASAATAWGQLGAHLRETQLLGSMQSTLYWDQHTRMPSAGAAGRGEQLITELLLAGLLEIPVR